jgi:uncharacterized protein (TIGR03435 family)
VQAATGGPLADRVRRLLGIAPRELGFGELAGVVAMVVAAGGILLHVDRLQAQEKAEQPRFDVASVKVSSRGDGIVLLRSQNGRVSIQGLSIAGLVQHAYGVQEFQVVGGPDWLDSARFDIQAVYPAEVAERREPGRESLMLRALLEDRFKLAVHKETRQLPVYALVAATSDGSLGPQLTRSTSDCTVQRPGSDCAGWVGPGFIRSRGKTMAQIATEFSKLTNTGSSLNRLVVDRTGLEGPFNMELRFTPEFIPPMGPRPDWLPEIDRNGPSIFAAVQEQLGLKLDAQRGPVEVLVVDRVERPTED